jgi:hypothetical protein
MILGPHRSVAIPPKGPSIPPSNLPRDHKDEVVALDHPNSSDNGLKYAPKP